MQGRAQVWLGQVVVLVFVASAAWLVWSALAQAGKSVRELRRETAGAEQSARREVDALRGALSRVMQEAGTLSVVPQPGPEPPWWRPLDLLEWQARDAAYRQYEHTRNELAVQRLRLEKELEAAEGRERALERTRLLRDLEALGRRVWNAVIAPILHLLLALVLMRLALQVGLRLLLLRGWFRRASI